MGATTLIYRDLVAELGAALPGQDLPPLILDVCVDGKVLADLNGPGGPHWQRGYRDYGTTPEDYAADVRNYDIATLYDPYVRHVFWFATNITEDTKSFDVNTPMLAIADGWHVDTGRRVDSGSGKGVVHNRWGRRSRQLRRPVVTFLCAVRPQMAFSRTMLDPQ